ncbi:MAG: hypothetical protein ACRC6M_01520, partial [Microcystaceae cyanobacterium]
MKFRQSHRKIALILFIPLVLSALTGVAYRIARSWFGVSDKFGDAILAFHEGEFLGKPLVPFYVLLIGLGLIALLITGFIMIKQKWARGQSILMPPKFTFRSVHGLFAPILLLPLFV